MKTKQSENTVRSAKHFLPSVIILLPLLCIFSCSSVFTGGANGRVADAESAETPKTGIAGADVYVYTDEVLRDSDFISWNAKRGAGKFSPSQGSGYVGHAATANDGTFTITKLVWQSYWPKFGKTADYCNVYLLFYHENFGLTKNSEPAVILSDGTGAFISQELTPVRNTTALQLSIRNAAADAPINEAMSIKITVPQPDGAPSLVYEQSVTGTASVPVSYPRKDLAGNAFTPEISISVFQGGDVPNWKMCNYDTTTPDYRFMDDSSGYPSIKKTVNGKVQPVNVYVKAVTLSMPSISGQVNYSAGTATDTDDGIQIKLAYQNPPLLFFSGSSSEVSTQKEVITGTTPVINHGTFSGLGNGITWRNTTYTELYVTRTVYIAVDKDKDGSFSKVYPIEIRSDVPAKHVGTLKATP